MADRAIDFEIRSAEEVEDQYVVTGLAVPFNQTVNIGSYKERFERGAFSDTEAGDPLFYNHEYVNADKTLNRSATPIGTITEVEETDDGLFIRALISKTDKGREVYQLLKDKVLKSFSAGFESLKHRTDPDGVIVRTKARLLEVSVVPRPAYSNAAVAEVRAETNNKSEETTMSDTDTIASEVAELREGFSDLERKFAVLGSNNKPEVSGSHFRSGGEFLKALASGEESAKAEFRAYTGATTADANAGSGTTWVNRALKVVEENRDVLNLWNKSPLPATGNTIEYPVFVGHTGDVALQATEGADLAYIEVEVGTQTASVKTYGGYSSLSRQAIERSDVAYLDTVLQVQAQSYAKATNGAVRAALAAATGQTATLANDNAQGWLRMILAARRAIKTGGNSTAAFVLVSADVYDRLFTLVDAGGRPLFSINGDGSNTVGSASLATVTGSIAGLPVVIDDVAASGTCVIAGTDAITVFEQPGAPVRLSDENVINLTKDFSLYGYLAVGVSNPSAIVKADVTL
ncbi:HK97 family phage prohead protease [Streptomyces sp. NP160]|uniref:HK97 family phage prohead protease n=1 Tax=Streptomyces sp. NP160 TaxID=2586637 RepID=UPI00111A052E|nr:HK97 family phage prohead protease [Streptomyces sp. NP160]TNM61532.1 HK97 family phage prohead protease [Streptomyces sp. NP160]